MDRSAVSLLLSNLRHSVELRFNAGRLPLEQREGWKEAILAVESLRVDFNSRRFLRPGTIDEAQRAAELRAGLIKLVEDENFMRYISGLRYRASLGPRLRDRVPPEYLDEGLEIASAIKMLIGHLEESSSDLGGLQPDLGLGQLLEIVPQQQIAPVKFDIVDERIVILDQPASIDPDDVANVLSARSVLLAKGEKIIAELARSNCDRRLVESIIELQNGLRSENNIVELGLINIGCSSVCNTARDELPDAVRGMIDGHTASISMFVAQFPEWQRFSEKAASVSLDASDISNISKSALDIAARLERDQKLADPEVPKTIRFLAALIRDPSSATKRAAFAVLRTIENLVAKIISYGVDLIDKTATKTIDGLSTNASRVIVIGLMGLAISSVTGLGTVTSKVAEAGWMKTAIEIVKKQVEGLG